MHGPRAMKLSSNHPGHLVSAALVTAACLSTGCGEATTFVDAGIESTDSLTVTDASGEDAPSPVAVRFTEVPPALTNQAPATFRFEVSAPGFGTRCRLDDASPIDCASPYDVVVAEGAHRLEVRAVDGAGLAAGEPAVHLWEVDTRAPLIAFTAGPGEGEVLTRMSSVTFQFTVTSDAVEISCRLWRLATTPPATAPCTSPDTRAVGDGTYTYEVHARDAAGNSSSAARQFRNDVLQ